MSGKRSPRGRSFGIDLEQHKRSELVGREFLPQLMTLVGVPGIGKSRLVTELFQIVDADPDPQTVGPALLCRGRALAGAGRQQEADALLDELLRAHDLADCWLHQLPLELAKLGRGREYLGALGDDHPPTPWLEAGRAAATGDSGRAAELYQEIGARTAEAQARLLAAEALIGAGRRTAADAELARALDYFRSVRATAYTSHGEALLAASA